MQIERQDAPDPSLRTELMRQLDAHNTACTGEPSDGVSVSILLRGPDGAVEGGLVGYTWYRWLVVEMLYLPPSLRGHGVGTQLMRSVETHAAQQGCYGIWLSTLSFQAPQFYERLGFHCFGTLAGRPRRHATMFMAKTALAETSAGLPVEGRADPQDRAVIARSLSDEVDLVAPGSPASLAFVIRNGDTVGGLWTTVSRGWMFLDLFVLPQALRRAGTGRRILGMAEDAARELGCRGIWLDTFSFQARPFYESLGYRVFGQLDDYPPGHARYFLSKHLDAAAALPDTIAR